MTVAGEGGGGAGGSAGGRLCIDGTISGGALDVVEAVPSRGDSVYCGLIASHRAARGQTSADADGDLRA